MVGMMVVTAMTSKALNAMRAKTPMVVAGYAGTGCRRARAAWRWELVTVTPRTVGARSAVELKSHR